MSLISVIVPVYQAEEYLQRCVESILSQSFTDFDCILVDDGSPDCSGSLCDEYAQKDRRIHVIHQKNSGQSAARNAGIDWALNNSDSEWLTFVDSDDWVHPDMLKRLYDAVVEQHVDVSMCSFFETDGDLPDTIPSRMAGGIWSPEDIFTTDNGMAVVPVGKLYRKKIWGVSDTPSEKSMKMNSQPIDCCLLVTVLR